VTANPLPPAGRVFVPEAAKRIANSGMQKKKVPPLTVQIQPPHQAASQTTRRSGA
jgi:hypothetical protein